MTWGCADFSAKLNVCLDFEESKTFSAFFVDSGVNECVDSFIVVSSGIFTHVSCVTCLDWRASVSAII